VSFWNSALPQLFDALRSFRPDTAPAHALVPVVSATARLRRKAKQPRGRFSVLAALVDVAAILVSEALASSLHDFAHGATGGSINLHLQTAFLLGLLFIAISAIRNDYTIAHYLDADNQLRRPFVPWCTAFAITLALTISLAGQTKQSLLPTTSLFVIGFIGVGFARLCLAHGVRLRAVQGHVVARRIFLIGFEAALETFNESWEPHRFGMQIVAASVLRGQETLNEDLALARAYARILAPDDVFVLVPWSDDATIEATINAFLGLPAALHLGPEKILGRFSDARITKIGPITSVNLVDHPLSPSALFMKRVFDLVLASLGLIIIMPLLLIVALAIRLDSPGPIIFRQHRYGFNQQPFRIFKFRSMSICEDHSKLVQITSPDDPRVTRVGAFLRRHNIDELPQLLNVILGDLSLVGPRPMAVVHDQMFERIIALYARRHNVKPGITGWAQINGCRGGLSEEKIRSRVEHDLYYIDHWSPWFDIKILWLTLASKEAYTDAF
jgi:putative colanic acid biosynthesis UDP-glucose lipid carrier transferase